MTLFGLVQVCMDSMTTDSGLLCGRSYHKCALGGLWHGT